MTFCFYTGINITVTISYSKVLCDEYSINSQTDYTGYKQGLETLASAQQLETVEAEGALQLNG